MLTVRGQEQQGGMQPGALIAIQEGMVLGDALCVERGAFKEPRARLGVSILWGKHCGFQSSSIPNPINSAKGRHLVRVDLDDLIGRQPMDHRFASLRKVSACSSPILASNASNLDLGIITRGSQV